MKILIITGANGHLGNTIINLLKNNKDIEIRGLVLSKKGLEDGNNLKYYEGDIRNVDSLIPLFKHEKRDLIYVIHTAAIISIQDKLDDNLYDVNVNGTLNIANLALKNDVEKFIYVSSVHALKVEEDKKVIKEETEFNPDFVEGGYAKTKAIATQKILNLTKKGLNAVIVQPSGIIGPYFLDENNHLIKMINDYILGKLPAGVKGGYDFVDVRDVASATINAIKFGEVGETYILANKHYEIKDIFKIIDKYVKTKKIPIIPIFLAKIFLPLLTFIAKKKKIKPLYTKYSLFTLGINDNFSHEKASKLLHFYPRDISITIKDTIEYLKTFIKQKNLKNHKNSI